MKNLIYAGVIILCLAVAGILIFSGGGSKGLDDISEDEQIWVICMECKASYQMGKKQYYEDITAKSAASGGLSAPYLPCEKCGKEAATEAIKCEECGEVFRKGAVRNDFPDRCPKCKFSKTETIRKERLAQ